MGLKYDKNASTTQIEKRMTIDMVGTTETSSGITFGAKLRIRSNEPTAGQGIAGARVYMQTSGFELAMGNIDGAIESMPNLYSPSVGLTGLGWNGLVSNVVGADGLTGAADTDGYKYFNWDSYSSTGNGAEGIEAIYSAGAFTGHVSYSEPTLSSGASAQKRAAAYGAYTMNDWTVALGVQKSSIAAEDKVVLTVGGNVGDYGVGIGFADYDGVKKVALNGSATFGATTVSAFVADEDSVGATDLSIGLGASYDLGGAKVVGGVERGATGNTRADLGVSFSF
jgi:outer membrane protein OmpU